MTGATIENLSADPLVLVEGNKVILALRKDGTVDIGEGMKPDEAGRAALDALVKAWPVLLAGARADEREACAVAAEQYLENGDGTRTDETQRWTAETIAADIRARTA